MIESSFNSDIAAGYLGSIRSRAHILVISPPPGDAPSWVRNAWVGLPLPIAGEPRLVETTSRDAASGREANDRGFEVSLYEATEVLRVAGHAQAARWWIDHDPAGNALLSELVFPESCCRAVLQD